MKYIEDVSVNEVIWRFLSGHFGDEVKLQRKEISENFAEYLLHILYGNDWKTNRIALGCLASCAGTDNPIANLILRKSPKSNWTDELKFARYSITPHDFYNFREVNYNKKLRNAIKKYKHDTKVLELRDDIKNNKFNFDSLNGIILYKVKSDYIIVDGVHRAIAIMTEILNLKLLLPDFSVICLENKIDIKRKIFLFKKQWTINDKYCNCNRSF